MLPFLGLLPIIHKDVGLCRIGGGPNVDPTAAPVLHFLFCACLDTPNELLDSLERPPLAQEQVNEGGESPVVVHRPPSPGLPDVASAQRPSFILPNGAEVHPWQPVSKEPRDDSLDTINRALDL